nr:hypothetical protein [Tanacetum cinerariifolium]
MLLLWVLRTVLLCTREVSMIHDRVECVFTYVEKEHGKQLLKSVKKGPFQFGTILVPRSATKPTTTRERTLGDLTPEYSLVNHHIDAKNLWDRVKLLMEGSELSLQERESKQYNEFDKFTYEKCETIHSYYL